MPVSWLEAGSVSQKLQSDVVKFEIERYSSLTEV